MTCVPPWNMAVQEENILLTTRNSRRKIPTTMNSLEFWVTNSVSLAVTLPASFAALPALFAVAAAEPVADLPALTAAYSLLIACF